jgi:hypothetical protein
MCLFRLLPKTTKQLFVNTYLYQHLHEFFICIYHHNVHFKISQWCKNNAIWGFMILIWYYKIGQLSLCEGLYCLNTIILSLTPVPDKIGRKQYKACGTNCWHIESGTINYEKMRNWHIDILIQLQGMRLWLLTFLF